MDAHIRFVKKIRKLASSNQNIINIFVVFANIALTTTNIDFLSMDVDTVDLM